LVPSHIFHLPWNFYMDLAEKNVEGVGYTAETGEWAV
jgi:hypothetical protein